VRSFSYLAPWLTGRMTGFGGTLGAAGGRFQGSSQRWGSRRNALRTRPLGERNVQGRIVIPLILDGREIGRAVADYTANELRLQGVS